MPRSRPRHYSLSLPAAKNPRRPSHHFLALHRKFRIHAHESLFDHLRKLRMPPATILEAVGLLLGRIEAFLSTAYEEKAFVAYPEWVVHAAEGPLTRPVGEKELSKEEAAGLWTSTFHLVVIPVHDHKLPRGRYRFKTFKGSTGLPNLAHQSDTRDASSAPGVTVKSLQQVTPNSPLAHSLGVTSSRRFFQYDDAWLQTHLLPHPDRLLAQLRPLADYGPAATYWVLWPTLGAGTPEHLAKEDKLELEWFMPTGNAGDGEKKTGKREDEKDHLRAAFSQLGVVFARDFAPPRPPRPSSRGIGSHSSLSGGGNDLLPQSFYWNAALSNPSSSAPPLDFSGGGGGGGGVGDFDIALDGLGDFMGACLEAGGDVLGAVFEVLGEMLN
ncbi:hypothetical protein JCM8097_004418 [Rhodosporidiobolus ruineniae]